MTGETTQSRLEAVVAVILRHGRVLVVRRAEGLPGAGYWTPVAGKVEPGETQARAVTREAREEAGLRVRPLRRVWDCVADGGGYDLYWWLAEYLDGELSPAADEVVETAWIAASEFATLEPTFPGDRRFFEEIFPRLPEWPGN